MQIYTYNKNVITYIVNYNLRECFAFLFKLVSHKTNFTKIYTYNRHVITYIVNYNVFEFFAFIHIVIGIY